MQQPNSVALSFQKTDTTLMIKINQKDNFFNFNGTSLVGYVTTTYATLEKVLGEPYTDFDKSTAHWNIQAPDGTVATIYDYKTYSTPVGEYRWHIGGHSERALLLVEFLLGIKPTDIYSAPWNPYGGGNDGDMTDPDLDIPFLNLAHA